MPVPDHVTTTRRRLGGVAVIAFPIVLTVSDLVAPSFAHGQQLVVAVAANPGRTWALASLRVVAAALFFAAIVAVTARVRGRGRRLANAAAVLGVLGTLGQAQDGAYQLFVLSLAHEDPARAGALLTGLDRLAGPLELPLLLAFALSLVLVVAGAWRGGIVPGWAMAAVVLAFLAHFVPGPIASHVADLLLIAGYAALGRRLLTSTGDDFDAVSAQAVAPAASVA